MVRRLREQGTPGRRAGETGAAFIRRLLAEGWLQPLSLPPVHAVARECS